MKIREAKVEDAAAIAHVQVDTWRVAYKGIICDAVLDALDYEGGAEKFRGFIEKCGTGTFAYVAENNKGEVAGFVIGGPERECSPDYEGEVYALYVRKEEQGRGIGRALLRQAVRRLKERGVTSLRVWVLEGNRQGRDFYEKLGGVEAGHKEHCPGCEGVSVTAYGWRDTEPLTRVAGREIRRRRKDKG